MREEREEGTPLQYGWEEIEEKGGEVWRFPVLAQRAVSEGPRWTRARRNGSGEAKKSQSDPHS